MAGLVAFLVTLAGGDSEGGFAGEAGPGASQGVGVAPESKEHVYVALGINAQGIDQLIGGFVIGLIALYSSQGHINFIGRVVSLDQQRGIWFIVASLAFVVVVAEGFCAAGTQLASRS